MALMDSTDYLKQLQALLPSGLAWARSATAKLTALLQAWADELARVDLLADALAEEADPRTTNALLTDWERVAGLPDSCVTLAQTVDQRRAALTSKLTGTGGQSRAYFINLLANMGFPGATIDEYPNIIGNTDPYTWRINITGITGAAVPMRSTSNCNVRLNEWSNGSTQFIECRITRYKPAHTKVLFAYP